MKVLLLNKQVNFVLQEDKTRNILDDLFYQLSQLNQILIKSEQTIVNGFLKSCKKHTTQSQNHILTNL